MSTVDTLIPHWKTAAGALACALALGAGAGWWTTSTYYDAEMAELTSRYSLTLKSTSDQAAADSEAARLREHDFQVRIAAQDTHHQQELNDEKAKYDQLVADVNAGRRRVQFANAALATCEQSAGAVRSASRLGDGNAIELSPTAGRNILAIRNGINEDRAKLVYLQEYIRALQAQGVIAK